MILMLSCIPICGFLWSFAGASGTSLGWRRLGVGFYISVATWLNTGVLWAFCVLPLMFIATSIGYGRPDSVDEGSPLGRFWFNLLKKSTENRFNQSQTTANLVDIFTRITVSIFYGLALLPLISIGSFHLFQVSLCFLVINQIFFTVLFKPNKMIFKRYSLEEAIVGSGIGFASFIYFM